MQRRADDKSKAVADYERMVRTGALRTGGNSLMRASVQTDNADGDDATSDFTV